MKAHNYLFRISCLELFYPVIINDDIYIIPNSDDMRDKYEVNLSFIDFNPSSFSYLSIMSEEPIELEELENLAKKVLSMLTILILNPLYLEEFYHFKYEGSNLSLVEATIKPFQEPDLKKKENYLHGKLGIYPFNEIVRDLYKKISNNPISDSLYSIIMEYIVSHKEPLIEISGTIAWNVLEHIASRYWNKRDKNKLYIIKKKKFNAYIKALSDCADDFIEHKINQQKDVLLDHPNYTGTYKSLLKNGLTPQIIGFSPVKFRIFKIFEEEGIEYESKKDLIMDMYDIRNKIYHDGLNIEQIKNILGKNPIDIIVKFRPFLYRKILELSGLIYEFFLFKSGHLTVKKEFSEIPNILDWEPDIKTKLDEYELIKRIKLLDDLFTSLIGTILNTHVKDEDEDYEVTAIISKKEGENIIKFFNFPLIFLSAFDKIPSKDKNYPEDIIKYLRPIICTFIDNNIHYEIEFYNRPIKYPRFNLKIDQSAIEKWVAEQYGKKVEIKKETSKIDFKINKITMKKND